MELLQKLQSPQGYKTIVKHEVIKLLEPDEVGILSDPKKFYKSLETSDPNFQNKLNDYKRGSGTTAYELLDHILTSWISGSVAGSATIEKLIEILRQNGFTYAAGVLQRGILNVYKKTGSDKPDASAITKNTNTNPNPAPSTSSSGIKSLDDIASPENVQTAVVGPLPPKKLPKTAETELSLANNGTVRKHHAGKSELDPTRTVDVKNSVVSLVRNVFHPVKVARLHTFLVLEGQESDRMETHFMDFGPKGNAIGSGSVSGEIRYQPVEGSYTESLIFKSGLMECKDKHKGKELVTTKSFTLTKDQANLLLKLFKEAFKKLPHPEYHFLGKESILNQISASSSSTTTGHNCFTWAAALLKDLNDPAITSSLRRPPFDWAAVKPK